MNISLRRALLGDAIFETICALVFIIGAGALANWTGWNDSALFVGAGVVLAGVALLLFWMVRQPRTNTPLARIVMILNAVFAVAGLLALIVFWSSLTDGARWLIGVIAVLVGLFAALEYAGLRTDQHNA